MTPLEKATKRMALWDACQNFIVKHEISCAESVWQMDSVQIAAPELVEEICEIVGYHKHEDD